MIDTLPNTALSVRANQLVTLALRCLPRMYQPDRRLFCFKMVERNGQMIPVDVSTRYTAMVIIGLQHAATCGQTVPWPMDNLLDGLLAQTASVRSIGDLGLILWATSVCDPIRTASVFDEIQRRWPHDVTRSDSPLETMQLAWLVSGLCHYRNSHPHDSQAEGMLTSAYNRLVNAHFERETFLYYFSSRLFRPVRKRLIHQICYFAEQVYGIQALLFYAQTTHNTEAQVLAAKTANVLVSHQTSTGGWRWLYNARTNVVVDTYPIYTVHQLGMAPMALLPLTNPAGDPLTTAIQNGVNWVFGENELNRSMLDEQHDVIWRSIKARSFHRQRQLLHKAFSVANLGALGNKSWLQPSSFQVDYECRPYELGWLLYALSNVSVIKRCHQ